MSNKMTCVGCDSHTSSVLRAFQDGAPCPVCGLSPETAREIEHIRQSRADEALREKLETALKERDEAQREANQLRARLARVETELAGLLSLTKAPLQPEPW